MLPLLYTSFLIQEEQTNGHHPMKFECSDGNIYYCKYLVGIKSAEIDCLAYEIIANRLLLALNIPTPEIALVQVNADSTSRKSLHFNKKAYPNAVCFGSKLVNSSSLVNATQVFNERKEVKRYHNYKDLIKIAIFDLLFDNADRGRKDNINLLEAMDVVNGKRKLQYVAIDHAFIFGGEHGLRFFKPTDQLTTNGKLIENEYFTSQVQHIPKKTRLQILEEFVTLYKEVYNDAVQEAFTMFHPTWQLYQNLNDRVYDYASNSDRLNRVTVKMHESLKNLK